MTPSIEPFAPALRAAFIDCWNAIFSGRPNFLRLTESLWLERVERKATAFEQFVPEHCLLAVDAGRVLGFAHGGVRPAEAAAICFPDWTGGNQSYIGCFGVRSEARRRGIATRLFTTLRENLGVALPFLVDGQCFNPFYGNSEYPFTPFWGTPEGIGIAWEDAATRAFLERQNCRPRFKAVTLEANLRALPPVEIRRLEPPLVIETRHNRRLLLDQPVQSSIDEPRGRFFSSVLLEGVTVRGYVTGWMMSEVAPDLGAIQEMHVSEAWQGRGVGGALLKAFFKEIKSEGARRVQTVTVPNLSPHALGFYGKHGFIPIGEWAVY